ncbi:MAG: LysM peptidoglycan-binding domain-containing M23 family metallopeptidase [Planctomycetota bacterium]|nr:LysM peptidoglycan-binding domain-containing M23 family metallopeptidase [Planctomycetota bacterium]
MATEEPPDIVKVAPPKVEQTLLIEKVLPAAGTEKSAREMVVKEPPVGFARYTVRAGDTISGLASRFGMSVETLKAVNNLSDSSVREGSVIFVPKVEIPENDEREPFSYPVKGRIVANFDTLVDNAPCRGIEIAVPFATAVTASRTGVVEYVSHFFPGYGGLVLIRHGNYRTLYGFLSEIYVVPGSRVRKGEILGRSGRSPYSGKERIRFRIYDGDTAINPLLFLK